MPLESPESPAPSSRRTVLRRGAAVSTAGGLALAAGSAAPTEAAFRPAHHRGAPLLSAADRHLVTRFSYGLTPALTRQVRRAGGARSWFERQLTPGRIRDTRADGLVDWWPGLTNDPATLWLNQVTEVEAGWEVMNDYQRWLLVRRITTNRQVAETMTEFWMNHFNVSVHHDATFTYRFDFDRRLRPLALGSFEQLLQTATTHPAMGMFLDNAVSTKTAPNENLGRELLELHTVGRGHYTEDDVKASARILTGYLVDMWNTWEAVYSSRDHWTGPVSVMGFHHANADPDGRAVVRQYLSYLARHPATAERIARKLCLVFVSDEPNEALVRRLADVYLRSNTQIKPVLRALVSSFAFKRSAGQKVRDPSADVVATYRALGVRLTEPPHTNNAYAANAIMWQTDSVGQPPCDWPRPDGQPLDNQSWSSPARMLASMDVHWAMSGRWWPSEGISYIPPERWLPRKRIYFDLLVDHLSQQLLGRRSTGLLLKACLLACQDDGRLTRRTVIDADHPLVRWGFHRLLATILDSPTHFTR
ncbi:hypothetical protein BH11ACT8_BH11ACT8_34620 [soil metagenome]